MHFVIIVEDSVTVKDGTGYEIAMGDIGIPSNVHAVQWFGADGEIEYTDGSANTLITELPAWAVACLDAHDVKEAEFQAAVALDDTPPDPADEARFMRDRLLVETDWWAMSDRTMTAEQTAYRQALRDITDQAGFPDNIVWPTKP